MSNSGESSKSSEGRMSCSEEKMSCYESSVHSCTEERRADSAAASAIFQGMSLPCRAVMIKPLLCREALLIDRLSTVSQRGEQHDALSWKLEL